MRTQATGSVMGHISVTWTQQLEHFKHTVKKKMLTSYNNVLISYCWLQYLCRDVV